MSEKFEAKSICCSQDRFVVHSCVECTKDYIVEVFFSVSKWCIGWYHTRSKDHWKTYLVVLITSYFEKKSVVAP